MEMKSTHKKLMLIGSTINPIHINNYYHLIKDYFDEIIIVGTHKVDFCKSYSIDFRIKNPLRLSQSIRQLRKLMIEFKPTIVHVHQANSFGYITSKANNHRFPQVLTTWGDDVLIFPHKNFIFRKLVRTSLLSSDLITADAEIMKTAIHKFIGNKSVEVINFGIELQNLPKIPKENILYSNRLHDNLYNIDKIILGSIAFLKSNPNWKLRIAGNGSNTETLKQQVINLNVEDQVEFVGFLAPKENLENYLKSKIYISIPNTDGTSISLLEAMAYGCLPVVSDLPANREWVIDGENGIIVKDQNINEALDRALKIDNQKAIEINSQIIENKATKAANRKKFTAIYDQLINR
jgi:glycosyltransferase involved in cell wall biosynthesis